MSDPTSTTEQLLSRIHAGDQQALNALMNLHREYLRRLVEFQMDPQLRQRIDPSDIVQETQIEVTQRMSEYLRRRPMSFRVWLRKTACQRIGMLRRFHLKARQRSLNREFVLPDSSSLAFAGPLSDDNPGKGLETQERAELLHSALKHLENLDVEILVMRTFEGLTNQEAAEALGLEPATASKRFGRALLRLKSKLTELGLTGR